MASINLYKINESNKDSFIGELEEKMVKVLEKNVKKSLKNFVAILYFGNDDSEKELSWNWVLKEFEQEPFMVKTNPRAVILIEQDGGNIYAITFGHSYFIVDKYCEREFGLEFARRLSYEEIKTTTLTSPNLQRNKVVNTYINYPDLEFDSGESFSKIKARERQPKSFNLYSPSIELGASIRVTTSKETIDGILDIILHVENVIATEAIKYKIPTFLKEKDPKKLKELDNKLRLEIKKNSANVSISELEIIGTNEIFNHNDGKYTLNFRQDTKDIENLTFQEIKQFCRENLIDIEKHFLDIKVIFYRDGQSVVTKRVKELIDYTIDEDKYLISKGVWYSYNQDYIDYLNDSVRDIGTVYNPQYDFTDQDYEAFIEERYHKEKNEQQYQNKVESDIKKNLKRKYYAERAFNLIREKQDGFKNYDRENENINGHKVEVMDLYDKEETIYAVKIGKDSQKLCAAIDQSISALKAVRNGNLRVSKFKKVALWLVLERETHLRENDGKPDLGELKMLMLKTRLDEWKKQVRLQGFTPIVYINYRTK